MGLKENQRINPRQSKLPERYRRGNKQTRAWLRSIDHYEAKAFGAGTRIHKGQGSEYPAVVIPIIQPDP